MRMFAAAVTGVLVLGNTGGNVSVHILAQHDPWRNPLSPPSVSVSEDGRYVAFASYARLAPADTNSRLDVYVLDRFDGQVTLESAGAVAADVDSGHPRISADGRFLVYEAVGPSVRQPTSSDIVLRDRRSGAATIVSAGFDGTRANGMSRYPAITQDGQVIVFSSSATNLVDGDDANGGGEDIYLLDTRDRRLLRVSLDSAGRQAAGGESMTPAASGDGRYVVFASSADLDRSSSRSGRGRPNPAVFLRDRVRNLTTRVGTASGGEMPDGASWAPAISADGRYVAFVSAATNLVSADRNRAPDVFLADLHSGAVQLVSRKAGDGVPGNGASANPVLSADGRFIAFQSEASNMVCARCTMTTEDVNLLWDVFLLDRQSGTLLRISRDTAGEWMAPSAGPAIDGAGALVVFSSRHPIDASDTANDWDLFLCDAPSGARGARLLRERPHRFDHRHQAHPFSHGDVLPEDPLDDPAIDGGYIRWG
jgi:Tol biopolymer transport system component